MGVTTWANPNGPYPKLTQMNDVVSSPVLFVS
jgi:hypothetical protein